MEIIKWEPLNDMDRMLDDRSLFGFRKIGGDFAVDVYEQDKQIVAKMILSDIDPKAIEIAADEDSLTISGRREEEKETRHKDYYSKEIRRGSFSRTIPLPQTVDAAKAVAHYQNGALTVKLPVTGDPRKKSVNIAIT